MMINYSSFNDETRNTNNINVRKKSKSIHLCWQRCMKEMTFLGMNKSCNKWNSFFINFWESNYSVYCIIQKYSESKLLFILKSQNWYLVIVYFCFHTMLSKTKECINTCLVIESTSFIMYSLISIYNEL